MKIALSVNLAYKVLLCFGICFGQLMVDTTVAPDFEILKTQFVDDGKTAILFCRSNDKQHLFLFWQLAKNDTVVGPGNNFNINKYDYEILSGNLIIRSVSREEEGVYHCVSRGVNRDDINVRSVRMVVNRDWKEVDEHDPGLNYFRGVVVTGSLLVVAGAGYAFYKLKKRHRSQRLLDASSDEEDSNEEIFRAPGTSRESGNIVIDNIEDDEVDVSKISIDFEDILKNSKK